MTYPTPMNKVPLERPRKSRRWNGAAYTCTDGVRFSYEYKVFEMDEETTRKMGLRGTLTAPMSGILLQSGEPPITVISGMQTSRDVTKIIFRGRGKTYTFPSTTTTVDKYAFKYSETVSVRLNEGLETLEKNSFWLSKVRRLIIPASVESIGNSAFCECTSLEYADLSAARGLRYIGYSTFHSCKALK